MTVKTLPKVRRTLEPLDCSEELAWLAEHRHEYLGEWVVLDGKRLIGHGKNPVPIVALARAQGVKSPFVQEIIAEPEASLGGWL